MKFDFRHTLDYLFFNFRILRTIFVLQILPRTSYLTLWKKWFSDREEDDNTVQGKQHKAAQESSLTLISHQTAIEVVQYIRQGLGAASQPSSCRIEPP